MATDVDDLRRAQRLIRDALDRSVTRHQRWRALETLYRTGSLKQAMLVDSGSFLDETVLEDEVVNLTLAHVNLIVASSVANDPRLLAIPIGGGPELEDYADSAEGVIQFFWKRTRARRHLRNSAKDAVVIGNGVLKTGWAHVGEDDELDDDEFLDAAAEALEEDSLIAELEGREPESLETVISSIDTSTERVETDDPWVEYVSPYDLFVPPLATELQDSPWVAQRITKTVEEVAEQFGIDEDDVHRDSGIADDTREGPSERARRAEANRDESFQGLGETYKLATYYEFWDVEHARLLIFQLNADEPLFDSDDDDADFPHGHARAPYIHIRRYRASGTDFWGFGDVENIANLQQMVNEMFTLQADNARRSGNIYFMDEEFDTAEVRDALESDRADNLVPVPVPPGKVMMDILQVARRHELSADVYKLKEDVEEYLRQVLGINDFQAGGVGADRMSATAAAVVDSVASLRAADMITAVEEAAAEVGQQLLLLCQEHLDEPRAIRLSGRVSPHWIQVTGEDLRGEWLIEVEAGSSAEETPQARENRGLQLAREILPMLVEFGMSPVPAIRQAIIALGFDPDLMMQPAELPPAPEEEGLPGEEDLLGELSEEDLMAILGDPEFAEGAAGRDIVNRGGPEAPLAAQLGGQPLL